MWSTPVHSVAADPQTNTYNTQEHYTSLRYYLVKLISTLITIEEPGKSRSKRGLNKLQGHDCAVNNLSKHFIFFNNNTICHRNITEGFKTGLAQVFFYVRSL